jgi:hypothetical protein
MVIKERFDVPEPLPATGEDLVEQFCDWLVIALHRTRGNVVLAIDGLDEIQNDCGGYTLWDWVPRRLLHSGSVAPRLRLVASSLSEAHVRSLSRAADNDDGGVADDDLGSDEGGSEHGGPPSTSASATATAAAANTAEDREAMIAGATDALNLWDEMRWNVLTLRPLEPAQVQALVERAFAFRIAMFPEASGADDIFGASNGGGGGAGGGGDDDDVDDGDERGNERGNERWATEPVVMDGGTPWHLAPSFAGEHEAAAANFMRETDLLLKPALKRPGYLTHLTREIAARDINAAAAGEVARAIHEEAQGSIEALIGLRITAATRDVDAVARRLGTVGKLLSVVAACTSGASVGLLSRCLGETPGNVALIVRRLEPVCVMTGGHVVVPSAAARRAIAGLVCRFFFFFFFDFFF